METRFPRLPPPPRLIATLASGFDIVANRLALILPPLLLDLFLWQGPHLRLYRLVSPWVERLPLAHFPGGPSLAEIQAARQAMLGWAREHIGLASAESFFSAGGHPEGSGAARR